MTKPSIIATRKPLPFSELSPLEFERMCLWLVQRLGYLRPEHLGEGGSDRGRDIVASKPTSGRDETWWFQCKRSQRVNITTLKVELDKHSQIIAENSIKRPTGIVFVTSAVMSARTREFLRAYCDQSNFKYEVWARTELDMLVKRFPEVVAEFFSTASATSQTALYQLPIPPADFTGRADELVQLKERLEQDKIGIIGIYGQGGIGKTALALKLAEELKTRYCDGQLHLDLRGISKEPLSAVDAMAHVIRAYHPTIKLPETESELSALFRSVLHNQQVLLLMDNAADSWQVRPLIPPEGCLLLVTSRQSFSLPGMFRMNLDSLARLDARKLLLKIAPRIADHAEFIAQLCAFLPLALRASATLLQVSPDVDPGDYAKRLTDEHTRIHHLGTEGLEVSVEASLNLSYESLDRDASFVFRRLSVFPGTFDAKAEEWICEDADHRYLSKLVRCSLVIFDADSKRYHLHDLIRLHVSLRLTEVERETTARKHATYYLKALVEADGLYCEGGDHLDLALGLFEREWGNIQGAHKWTENNIGSDQLATKICTEYPRAGRFLLSLTQDPREHLRWLDLALRGAQQLNDRDAQAFLMNSLGQVHSELGAHKQAAELHEQALAIAIELKNYFEEARSLVNLGTAHAHCEEGKRGIELQTRGLEIFRELKDRRSESDALNRLGWSYADIGEYRCAIEAHEQALSIARDVGDRREEGIALEELGWAYSKLNEVSRAIELQEQGLVIFQKLGASRDQGKALRYLGNVFNDSGEAQRAIEMHQQGLLIAQELGNSYEEGIELDHLGWAHKALGNHDRAIDCHQRAAEAFHRTGHAEDESVALYSLAESYCEAGEAQTAVAACRAADGLARKDGNRWRVGDAFLSAGNIYLDQEDYESASDCYEHAIRIAREVSNSAGEGHALYNLGLCHTNLNDSQTAIIDFQKSLAAYRVAESKEDASDALQKLAERYSQTKEYDQAIDCCKTLLAETTDRLREVDLIYSIGQLHDLKGDYLAGIELFKEALSISLEMDNPRNVGTIKFAIGRALFKTNQHAEAVNYAEESLPVFQGVEDLAIRKSAFYTLGHCYHALDNLDRAIEYLEKYLVLAKETGYLYGHAETLYNIANFRLTLNPKDLKPSIDLYEQSLILFREMAHKNGELAALNNLAIACNRLEDHRRAVEYLEAARIISRELGQADLEQTIIGNLGDAFMGKGDNTQAIQCYEAYLVTLRKSDDRPKEALILNTLGSLYSQLYDYARAAAYAAEALQVSQTKNDRVEEARALLNLGLFKHRLGQAAVALEFYQQSLNVCPEIDEPTLKCDVLNRLGSAYLDLGDAPRAVKTLEDAIVLARTLEKRLEEACVLDSLGKCYFRLGYGRLAIPFQEDSLSLFRELDAEKDAAIVLTSLGEALSELGESERARAVYDEALIIARRTNQLRTEASALNGLAVVLMNAGEIVKAKEMIETAIDMFRETSHSRGESEALNNLGNVHRKLLDCQKALELHNKALKISQRNGDRFGEGIILGSLGDDFRSAKEFPVSLTYYEKQLEHAQAIGDRQGEARSQSHASKVLGAINRPADARRYANAAIKTYKSIEDQSLIELTRTLTSSETGLSRK